MKKDMRHKLFILSIILNIVFAIIYYIDTKHQVIVGDVLEAASKSLYMGAPIDDLPESIREKTYSVPKFTKDTFNNNIPLDTSSASALYVFSHTGIYCYITAMEVDNKMIIQGTYWHFS